MMSCRICKGRNLEPFLDLGFTPPADQFLLRRQLHEPETHYPLTVLACTDCGLVQLSYVVPPEVLYQHDYPYESSTTQTGRRHWAEFAETTRVQRSLKRADLVVDIGSNVGVLLDAFKSAGSRVLGVDPASNIALIAERRGIPTINDFFGIDVARQIVSEHGPAAVITATNVFAHVDDLDAFMTGIEFLLAQEGVFIFEAPYLANLLAQLEYDTIYHEHLSYLSVRPLIPLFGRFGMEIVDIQQRDIHGGSFRVYVSRKGRMPVDAAVDDLLRAENAKGLYDLGRLHGFAAEVSRNRAELLWLLRCLKQDGKRVAGVSAPAKGMTLLNYCHIGTETLDFVTEKAQLKIGRFTPGTHIPVLSDDELIAQKPDYALLLAWNFAEEIMNNLSGYRAMGGKFIVPIPRPHVVG
jgi:hypothetical protein